MLLGAIVGFLAGLLLQSRGVLTTGMVSRGLSPEGLHFLGVSLGITVFVAAACGIVGAFLGAVLEDAIAQK
jgi:uncharacterized membrane protein YeaQ/YmgE (transglycosylase-associated protein family)